MVQLVAAVAAANVGAQAIDDCCPPKTRPALTLRTNGIRQMATPVPTSGRGTPPSCSSAPAMANAPGWLISFQVVSIQPSEGCAPDK
jgi:hypothetical protein